MYDNANRTQAADAIRKAAHVVEQTLGAYAISTTEGQAYALLHALANRLEHGRAYKEQFRGILQVVLDHETT